MKIYSYKLLFAIFLLLISACSQEEKIVEKHEKADTLSQFHFQCRETYHLKKGSNLFQLLTKQMDLEDRIAEKIIFGLKDSVSLKRLRPRDEFMKCWDENQRVSEIIFYPYRDSISWNAIISYSDSSDRADIAIKRNKLSLNRYKKTTSTTIEDNLYNAFIPDLHPEFVYRITEILQWDIDFLIDPRVGDKIVVQYENIFNDVDWLKYGQIYAIIYLTKTDTVAAVYYPPMDLYYGLDGGSVRKTFLKSPLRYSRISSSYNKRRYHPIKKIYRPHNGVDFVAPYGTPVSASADGTVIFKGWKNGFGNTVILRHGAYYKTLYGHLSGYKRGLRVNQKVGQNQTIGFVGKTGTATGNHLHYTFYKNGKAINPMKIKNPSGASVPDSLLEDYKAYADSMIYKVLLNR